jgi:large subunit ribosomal protein L10
MNRSEKEQIVEEVQAKVVRAKSMFFADFTGITVEQVNELRREFRKSNIGYSVVKNTLARKALESAGGYDKVLDRLEMPTAIAFGFDDPIAPAKVIKKFSDKNDKLKIKVCIIEGQVFEGKDLALIAKLPSRSELMSGILGCVVAPITGVVGAINAVMRDLVYVVGAIEEKKKAA